MASLRRGARNTRGIAVSGAFSRRRFLRGLALAGLLGGVPALSSCGAGSSRGDDGGGAASLPRTPRGVVSLGYEDEMLALGVVPVAAGTTYTGGWYPHLRDRLGETRKVGFAYEPNLEQVAAAEPDLIVADEALEPDIGDELRGVSCTAFVEFSTHGGSRGVRENLAGVAEALGLTGRAERRFADHEKKMARSRSRLEGVSGTVAFLRVLEAEYRLVTPEHGYIGPVIYGDLGLSPPPYVVEANERDQEGTGYVNVSLELIPEVGADRLFFLSDDDDTLEELRSSPLWKGLEAVKRDNVYRVDPVYWQTTAILANEAKAEDVVKALTA